jgi:hypothetical protein
VYDKQVWMCTELKKTWRFQTAVLQSMVSGETVPVHAKNKLALDIKWTQQGLLVGNELPVLWMDDANNQLSRRVISFPFDKAPRTQDPRIQRDFMANLARFLVRVTRRYVQAALVEVVDTSVDIVLPQRLKDAKADFVHNTQPLIRFLDESQDYVLATEDLRRALAGDTVGGAGAAPAGSVSLPPDAGALDALRKEWRVRMTEIQARFKEWWMQNNLGGGKPAPAITTREAYGAAVKQLGMSVMRDPTDHMDYMYGLKPLSAVRGLSGGSGGGIPITFGSL